MAIGALIRNTQFQVKLSTSQPPRIGPTTGATSVVIDQMPMAAPAFSLGKMRSISVCDSGISGPPLRPWNTRATTSMPIEVDSPHTIEKMPNRIIDTTNTRTAPKRAANQPVSGTVMASPTANEVMTQVPWLAAAPSAPAMLGTATLAIVMLRTAMKLAAASIRAATASIGPFRGATPSGAKGAGAPGAVVAWLMVAVPLSSLRCVALQRRQPRPWPACRQCGCRFRRSSTVRP